MAGWVGFDLDGTLARYDGWSGGNHIGAPIAPMIERVKDYIARGVEVRIVTARAGLPEQVPPIVEWCLRHIGQALEVTDRKDFGMILLYDDRAAAVEFNTGRVKCW